MCRIFLLIIFSFKVEFFLNYFHYQYYLIPLHQILQPLVLFSYNWFPNILLQWTVTFFRLDQFYPKQSKKYNLSILSKQKYLLMYTDPNSCRIRSALSQIHILKLDLIKYYSKTLLDLL